MSKVLIVGAAGHRNVGDDAIALRMVSAFTDAGHRVTLAGGANKLLTDSRADIHVPWAATLSGRSRLAGAVAMSGHIVIGGGGLFDDRVPTFFRPYYRVAKLCRALGKPYSVVGVGVGPIQHASSERAYREVADGARHMAVRDNESRDRLVSIGVRRDIRVISDPIFWQDSTENYRIPATANGPDLVINLRNWTSRQSSHFGDRGIDISDILGDLAWAVNNITPANARIGMLSMSTLGSDDDRQVLDGLGSKIEREIVTFYSPTVESAHVAIASSCAVLSMRLHGSLIAKRVGTPAAALAYDKKVVQQAELYQIPHLPLDSQVSRENIHATLNSLLRSPRPTHGVVVKDPLAGLEFD